MRKVLLSMLALCSMGVASAQMSTGEGVQARVYAYNLQLSDPTDKDVEGGTIASYVVTFKTNTAATSAVVNLKDANGEVVGNGVEATSNDGKNWTAEVDVTTLGANIVAGEFNWEVTVSAPAVTAWNELAGTPTYGDKKSAFRFYRSFGLCVNQNPESEYFGNVYAAHQFVPSSKIANYRSTGMYVYNPDLTLQNNGNPYANSIFGTGEATTSSASLADMCISEDGRLFFTATDASIYNVYELSPSDLTNPSKVFNNATYGEDQYKKNSLVTTEGEDATRLTGIRGAITAIGNGENTELMVLDSDLYLTLWTTPINCFAIGNNNQWTESTPSHAYGPANGRMIYTYNKINDNGNDTTYNKNIHIERGYAALESTKTGFWAVQTNKTTMSANSGTTLGSINGNESFPTLFYYSKVSGKVESINNTLFSNLSPALAVNENLGLVAFTTTGSGSGTPAVITKYAEDENGKITILNTPNATDYLMTMLGSKADAMSFDYAGNLYAVTSGNETMAVYALPDALVGANTCTTPAKKALTIEITADDITTGVDNIAIDANAPVEYYNLQGVKVENPTKGIFIKKQGAKATKVVL